MHFPGYKNITVAIREDLAMGPLHLSGIPKSSISHFLRTKFAHIVIRLVTLKVNVMQKKRPVKRTKSLFKRKIGCLDGLKRI